MLKDDCLQTDSKLDKVLNRIERVGNSFPHPFLLFIILSIILLIIAETLEGITFTVPGNQDEIQIVSLLNKDGFIYMLSNLLPNFIKFPLIPLIIAFTLAIGVGEKAGFYDIIITNSLKKIHNSMLIPVFLFIAINGNIISDAALILLPTIGASLFIMKGRNPVLAIMVGYAGYLAGLSANIIIAGTDVLVAGITTSILPFLDITKDLYVHPASNWYFLGVSAILLTITGTFITTKYVEPKLDQDKTIIWDKFSVDEQKEITPLERKGLRSAFISTIIYLLVILIMVIPKNGWLRDPETQKILPNSPFMNNITVLLAFYFFIIGLLYGISAKTIKSSTDVADGMASGLKSIVSILVVFFFAAQFVAYFNVTNLGPYIAVKSAEFLTSVNFTGIGLIILIIFITSIIDFFIGTIGSKWSVMGPILIPMLALLGYHPAFAQVVYRIGDAITNTVNPISTYIPIILMYIQKYKKDAGIGTIIKYQIPYFLTFTITWIVQLIIWYVFDLPLGPGAPIWI